MIWMNSPDYLILLINNDKIEILPEMYWESRMLKLSLLTSCHHQTSLYMLLFNSGAAVGSLDDSLKICLSLSLKQPKKDVKKMLDYAGKTLRFSAELVSVLLVDSYRTFIISYYLEDDSLSIFEPARPNSGMR